MCLETETTVGGLIPHSPELGESQDLVTGVAKVVTVDLFMPVCPLSAGALYYAVSELLAGRVPIILSDGYLGTARGEQPCERACHGVGMIEAPGGTLLHE